MSSKNSDKLGSITSDEVYDNFTQLQTTHETFALDINKCPSTLKWITERHEEVSKAQKRFEQCKQARQEIRETECLIRGIQLLDREVLLERGRLLITDHALPNSI